MPAGEKKPSPVMRSKKTREGLKAKTLRHEKELAVLLDGHTQPASGAMAANKGDVKLKHFLLDSKQTDGGVILVDGKMLTKITRESDGEKKKPGLVLTIEQLPSTVEKEWALIPLSVFWQMLQVGQDENLD